MSASNVWDDLPTAADLEPATPTPEPEECAFDKHVRIRTDELLVERGWGNTCTCGGEERGHTENCRIETDVQWCMDDAARELEIHEKPGDSYGSESEAISAVAGRTAADDKHEEALDSDPCEIDNFRHDLEDAGFYERD